MGKYGFTPAEVAEQVAIAISHKEGIPVRTDQVEIEPLPEAGQFLVTVHENVNSAQQVIPYIDNPTPVSLTDMCTIGYRTNRKPYLMNPYQHGLLVGATESGKSSLIHVLLAHYTRCPKVVIWVGGVWKLYDFVAGWLESYLDTGILSPIDWVAHGHTDVREMMAAALRIAAWRMNQRMGIRASFPTLIVILDELTYIFEEKHLTVCVNDVWMKADKMVSGIARGTAGAGIYELLATQRQTMDNAGDDGGTVIAQMQFVAVFPIRDQGTTGQLLGKYNLQPPKQRGVCWFDPGLIGDIVKLRIPYIQTIDPRKPKLHTGPTVLDVSWSRRHIEHVLDPGSAVAAGSVYANRHRYVTNEMISYLTTKQEINYDDSVSAMAAKGNLLPGISISDFQAAEQEYDRLMALSNGTNGAMANADPIDTEGPSAQSSTVSVIAPTVDENGTVNLARYRTRVDMVKAVLRAAEKPLARAEIIERLEQGGHKVGNPQTVTTILGNLIKPSDGSPAEFGRTPENLYYAL